MIVYFSASARDIKENISIYRVIIQAVQEMGGIMTHNWIETALLNGIIPREDDWWCDMTAQIQTAIKDADYIVVEASGASTLGVGFELARALQANKPTLALVRADAEQISYVRGIKHTHLFIRTYTQKSLRMEVKKFLRAGL